MKRMKSVMVVAAGFTTIHLLMLTSRQKQVWYLSSKLLGGKALQCGFETDVRRAGVGVS